MIKCKSHLFLTCCFAAGCTK